MKKEDINNILLVNGYLVSCEFGKQVCEKKTELARKYLSNKISKALKSKTDKSPRNFKAFFMIFSVIFNFNL